MKIRRFIFSAAILIFPAVLYSKAIVYPGSAPCNSTLQACINAADSGDVIRTAALYIDESIQINKSLTLIPSPGFNGTFIGTGGTPRFVSIEDSPNGETLNITLDGLVLSKGAISITLNEGSGHNILIRNSNITANLGFNSVRGIYTDIRTSASITVEKTLIQSHGYAIDFRTVGDPSDAIYFKAIGNRIFGLNSNVSTVGIEVDFRGAGYAEAIIQSNVIWDVAWCGCGLPAAINLSTKDDVDSIIRVINNTIDHIGGFGIFNGPYSGTGVRNTYIYNNIVTNVVTGFYAPSYVQSLGVVHNNNDFFGNSGVNIYGGYSPGPQTYNFNPLNSDQGFGFFVLQPNSPAIDAGTTASGAVLSNFDATQGPRLLGFAVDLGAYESSFVANTEYMLAAERFGQVLLPSEFSYPKGTWSLDGNSAIGYSEKKASFLASPAFSGCEICQFETTFKISGNEIAGRQSRLWIQAWHQGKSDLVEVIVKEAADKLTFRQKVGGKIVSKASAPAVIKPYTEYRMKFVYDGLNILVFLDGNQIFAIPAAGDPSGTFGFQAKATYGYIGDFWVHY